MSTQGSDLDAILDALAKKYRQLGGWTEDGPVEASLRAALRELADRFNRENSNRTEAQFHHDRQQTTELSQRDADIEAANRTITQLRDDAARVRPKVLAFALIMEEKLRENDHRGGWENDTPRSLLKRLDEETVELHGIVTRRKEGGLERGIAKEAADVANFAMMVADVCGGLASPPATEPRRQADFKCGNCHDTGTILIYGHPEPCAAICHAPAELAAPASAQGTPECLRTMTPEEQAAFKPLTNEQIVEALARGQRDKEAAERPASAQGTTGDLAETDMRKQLQEASRLLGKLESRLRNSVGLAEHERDLTDVYAKVEALAKRVTALREEFDMHYHVGQSAPMIPAPEPPQPAPVVGVDLVVPGSERTMHHCTGCEWTLNTTAMTGDVITQFVHEHLAKEHNAQMALDTHAFLPPPDGANWCDANVKKYGYRSCGQPRSAAVHGGGK